MKSVGITAHAERLAALECVRRLAACLEGHGIPARMAAPVAVAAGLPRLAVPEADLAETELLVALGGDGTLLGASRIAAPAGVPVLGIHVGGPASFGFLTETTPDLACEALERVLGGDYRIEERLRAAVTVLRNGAAVGRFHALNELVIRAQARLLKMRVSVGETYIATYAADGILVATPTGSTAYNLAAGGPLVYPAVQTLILTPICPHTLNVRSLLVGVDDVISVTLGSGERDVILLTVDGQVSFQLEPGDHLLFQRSEQAARFVSLNRANFYEKVQTRLRLGERFGS